MKIISAEHKGISTKQCRARISTQTFCKVFLLSSSHMNYTASDFIGDMVLQPQSSKGPALVNIYKRKRKHNPEHTKAEKLDICKPIWQESRKPSAFTLQFSSFHLTVMPGLTNVAGLVKKKMCISKVMIKLLLFYF